MSSASMIGKRSLKKSHSRNIESSSTSITSAPPTTSESKLLSADHNNRRGKEKNMRSKQRDSLPDISARKSTNKIVRASNFELSSSANGFSTNDNMHSSNKILKAKATSNNASKVDNNANVDDTVSQQLKVDAIKQEQHKFVLCVILIFRH